MTEADAARRSAGRTVLGGVPLLRFMPDDVREVVAASFVRQTFGFGEVVVAEGDEADAFYVVASGRARRGLLPPR